jgi:D-alanine-D-alanine ligase
VGRYGQAALVEQYIDGREVCAGLLGNDPAQVLPAVELSFENRALRLMTWDDKYHRRTDEPRKLCPALLDPGLLNRIEQIARTTFECCHGREYARVDIRIDDQGHPWVLEPNSMASLGAGGSYMRAAHAAGYSFEDLVDRIVDVAYERSYGIPRPRRGSHGDDRSDRIGIATAAACVALQQLAGAAWTSDSDGVRAASLSP